MSKHIEVEGGEVINSRGKTYNVKGKKHEFGGVDLNVSEGSFVYPDRILIDNKSLSDRASDRQKLLNKYIKRVKDNPNDKVLNDTFDRIKLGIEIEDKKDRGIIEAASGGGGDNFAYGGYVGGRSLLPNNNLNGSFTEDRSLLPKTYDFSNKQGYNLLPNNNLNGSFTEDRSLLPKTYDFSNKQGYNLLPNNNLNGSFTEDRSLLPNNNLNGSFTDFVPTLPLNKTNINYNDLKYPDYFNNEILLNKNPISDAITSNYLPINPSNIPTTLTNNTNNPVTDRQIPYSPSKTSIKNDEAKSALSSSLITEGAKLIPQIGAFFTKEAVGQPPVIKSRNYFEGFGQKSLQDLVGLEDITNKNFAEQQRNIYSTEKNILEKNNQTTSNPNLLRLLNNYSQISVNKANTDLAIAKNNELSKISTIRADINNKRDQLVAEGQFRVDEINQQNADSVFDYNYNQYQNKLKALNNSINIAANAPLEIAKHEYLAKQIKNLA